ncbi:MICOS complex subunit mic60 [Microsporum audouinii]
MLRNSIAPSRGLGSLTRQRAAGPWLTTSRRSLLGKRGYSKARSAGWPYESSIRPGTAVLPTRKTSCATFTSSATLRENEHNVRSPPSPSSASAIAPEGVSKPPPSSPATQGLTSPGSSVNPPEPPKTQTGAPPPPPPPPARKAKGKFTRFLLYLVLTTGVAYAGGVWFSLKSDNFHDFFTEYVPYGEEAVLYLEELDFRRRFPNATRHINTRPAAPRDEGEKVTIPSKSGVSWKVAEKEGGSDVSQKGRHMSALDAETSRTADKSKSTPKRPASEDKVVSETTGTKKDESNERVPVTDTKKPAVSLDEPRKPAVPTVSSIEPLAALQDDATIQELTKIVNSLITVINADESASKLAAPLAKAKEDFLKLGEQISRIKEEALAAAKEEINNAHLEFDRSATELVRRIDEVRAEEAAQYREEFEMEREKLAHSYQEKIKTEIERANAVAEQRLRNELVEQAIEMNRKFLNDVETLVEKERGGRLSKLSELTAQVAELEKLTAGWNEVIGANLTTQQLQVAVDAVHTALESDSMPRPFINELLAVKGLAGQDPIVNAAISSINPTAYQRGIPSTSQVIDRFRRVANEVRKASLLPEDAGVASHATSYLMSKVMFKKEVSSSGDDVESILTRTEKLLEEGNLDEAAREMNALRGWSKLLSKDWLADVRRVLEVRQAMDVIQTEARLKCLQFESLGH